MKIKTAQFVVSNTSYLKCPLAEYPEYAFIGRSNVGKSSLINMLTNRKKLAKISSRPGKTQLINHFMINESWYLVDLPGYGWARVSKSTKARWGPMTEQYIRNRKNLCTLFILIDSRLEPQKIDLAFIHWAGLRKIPITLVLTKCDVLSKNKTNANLALMKRELSRTWEELPPIIQSSSVTSAGKEELLTFIEGVNNTF